MKLIHWLCTWLTVGLAPMVAAPDVNAATTSVTESWLLIQDLSRSKVMVLPVNPAATTSSDATMKSESRAFDVTAKGEEVPDLFPMPSPTLVPTEEVSVQLSSDVPLPARSGILLMPAMTPAIAAADAKSAPDTFERGTSLEAIEAIVMIIAALIALALHRARRRDVLRR